MVNGFQKIELFERIANGFQLLIILHKVPSWVFDKALNMSLSMVLRIKEVRALIVKLVAIKIKRVYPINIFNLKI